MAMEDVITGIWKSGLLLSAFFYFFMLGRLFEKEGMRIRNIFNKENDRQ